MSVLLSKLTENRLNSLISEVKWYHTFELHNNTIIKGRFNHKPFLKYYGFPKSLKNQDILDVGAADGFFSFVFERRGARNVLAVDTSKFDGSLPIDPTPTRKEKFKKKYSIYKNLCEKFQDVLELLNLSGLNKLLIVKDLLESNISFKNLSIYDLDSLGKKFDLVFCGDLFKHLKNPIVAMEKLVSVTNKLCIISTNSYASKTGRIWLTIERILKKIFTICDLKDFIIDPYRKVEYLGNYSGSAFFKFHPLSFKEALLASGFKKVSIFSKFNLPDNTNTLPHTVFHCKV